MKKFLLTAAVALLMASPSYAQVAGKWATEAMGTSGTPQHAFEFKVEGGKLTGVYVSGNNPSTLELSDGTVSGSEISFNIVRTTGQGAGSTTRRWGEMKGDSLTLNGEALGADGARTPREPIVLKRLK